MRKFIIFVLVIAVVIGLYAWSRFSSSGPAVSPTPTATPDVTLNWQTYSNNQWGYFLKFPNDWTLTEQKDVSKNIHTVAIKSNKSEDAARSPITISVVESQQPRVYVDRLVRMNPPNNKTERADELGGLGAIRFRIQHSTKTSNYVDTLVVTRNEGITYAVKCHDEIKDPCNFEIFEGIISSFKFLH